MRSNAVGTAPKQSLVMAVLSTAALAGILWYFMGWVWALAGVVGVFVHEYGHVLAMNRLGCGPARIHIVPFLGGAAVPARAADTEFKDVLISLAGPSFGLIAAIPFFAAHTWTGDAVWLEGALFVGFINLINLAPAPPLDGSRALGPSLAQIHPMVERVVLGLVAGLAVLWAVSRGSWIFAVFVALGAFGALRSGSIRPEAVRLTRTQSLIGLGLYLATAAMCIGLMMLTIDRAGLPTDPAALLGRLLKF